VVTYLLEVDSGAIDYLRQWGNFSEADFWPGISVAICTKSSANSKQVMGVATLHTRWCKEPTLHAAR